MSDNDLFDNDGNKQPAATPQTPQNPDPFVDKLMEIKNENGEPKYKDVATALDALSASQQFIETLKQEKKTLEEKLTQAGEQLTKMGSIDDFVKRIAPNANPQRQEPATPTNTDGLSEEKIRQLLAQELSSREEQSVKKSNLEKVIGEVSKAHGDKASAFIKQRAEELSTTPAALKELAQSNPQMALSLLGGGGTKPFSSSPSRSTIVPPISTPNNNEPPKFERGVARGGFSNKELTEMFRRSKEYTNKRIGLDN